MIPLQLIEEGVSATLVWGLFLRGLGVVYFIAIAQLYHQVLPCAGSRGITPVYQKLARIRLDYPGWRGWLYFPTLLWLNASDRFLKILVLIGAIAALVVVYGGPLSGLSLFICWVIYLSLDRAMGFTFPWDCLLLEAGFLSLFLPPLLILPDVAVTTAPLPVVAWAYRWLFFRLIVGFGKYKFIGGSLRDTGYFRNFMINIPLPTYLAWYAYRLPRWVFQGVLVSVFIAEIVLPFGVFVSGETRLVVALITACLMIGIQLVSNFGFFNVLTIVLCLSLLDTKSSILDTSFQLIGTHWLTHGIIVMLAVGGLLNLPVNSWCTQTWLYWPSLMRIRLPGSQVFLRFYRLLSRFRVVHAYGVFPPKSSPPIHWVPIIEGSQDGVEWLTYEYRYMTTTETTPPRFVAPYHPRLDHAIFYESYGTNDANFVWSALGANNPHDFSHTTGAHSLMQRILEGEPSVLSLFRHNPFSQDSPPRLVRMTLYRFQPTTPAERHCSGRWWTRTFAGTHLPPTQLNTRFWEQPTFGADLFHPDAIHWKRRSPRIRALQRLAETGSADQLWPAIGTELSMDVRVFWNEFIPLANRSGHDWQLMPEMVAQFREMYDWRQRQELEVMLNRLSLALLAKLEPYFLGKSEPQLIVSEYFQLCLLTHHIMAKGQTAYVDTLRDPTKASQYLTDFEPEHAFYYLGLFWFDTLVYQARKFRLAMQISTVIWGNGLPGFLELVPFISRQFTDIGEENLPILHRNPVNGEWLVMEKQLESVLTDTVTSVPSPP